MSDNDKRETHAAVIAEMRECEGYRAYYDGGKHHDSYEESVVGVDYLRDFTDRLEAAHRRELAEAEARGLDAGGIVEAARQKKATDEKSSAVGDAAKLREALEEIRGLARTIYSCCDKGSANEELAEKIVDIATAALAAPPRQCDIGTVEEQVMRWRGFCACEKGGVCDGCPCLKNSKGVEDCYAKWAQMPYVEKEGGAE